MKIEDAKANWCPFVQFTNMVLASGSVRKDTVISNRGQYVENSNPQMLTRCIGRECMAWREAGPNPDLNGYCGLVER